MGNLEGEKDDDKALQARLEKLSTALEAQRKNSNNRVQQEAEAAKPVESMGRAMSLGFRVLSEFVAAIVVGGFVGWQLDAWLGTGPWFLIVLLGFGTASGFWNVYRIAMNPTDSRQVKRDK